MGTRLGLASTLLQTEIIKRRAPVDVTETRFLGVNTEVLIVAEIGFSKVTTGFWKPFDTPVQVGSVILVGMGTSGSTLARKELTGKLRSLPLLDR